MCRYLTDREVFADSVYLYRANGRRDCKAFVEGLKDALLQSGNNPVSTQLLALSSTYVSAYTVVFASLHEI